MLAFRGGPIVELRQISRRRLQSRGKMMHVNTDIRSECNGLIIRAKIFFQLSAKIMDHRTKNGLCSGALMVGPEKCQQVLTSHRLVMRGKIIDQSAVLTTDLIHYTT